MLIGEVRCLVDRVQLHTEKRNALHRRDLVYLPIELKSQPAEVPGHQVPVFAQLIWRLGQNEPVLEIVEDANAHLPEQGKGSF